MKIRLAIAGIAAAGLLAGCADVIDGTGTIAGTGGPSGASSTPDFPTPSGGASVSTAPATGPATGSATGPSLPQSTTGGAAPTRCPHVTYAAAKLSFDCLGSGFVRDYTPNVWPLRETKTVEPTTGWVVEEGAGHWGSADGNSLGDIAKSVRGQMVDGLGYGPGPKQTTVVDKDTTVGGVAAHILQTTFTLDPSWAQTEGTKVKQEKLWIVALQVGSNDVSLWYASIPDLASALWAKVPAIVASIKVG